jgi:hypothetical protein
MNDQEDQDLELGDELTLARILNAPSEDLIEEESVVELFKGISWSDLASGKRIGVFFLTPIII